MEGSCTDWQAHQWLQEGANAGWISLHFDSPGLPSDNRNEFSGGGYVRVKMSWTQPSNRTIWSTDDARFVGLVANRITHFGIWDQKNGGHLRAYGQLPKSVVVTNGQGHVLPQGSIAVSVG